MYFTSQLNKSAAVSNIEYATFCITQSTDIQANTLLCFLRMKTKCSNFDGNWDDICEFCGKPQINHQYHLGDLDGVRHLSRMPCEKQRYVIRKEAVKRGIVLRTIIFLYDVFHYLWGLIPFKEEMKLIWQGLKHIFISIRAVLYLKRKKPK